MTATSTQVTSLLSQFGLTTAAEELVPRLTEAGDSGAMPVLVEVFEAEAQVRRQRWITRAPGVAEHRRPLLGNPSARDAHGSSGGDRRAHRPPPRPFPATP